MNNINVSIILPVYNAESYINKTLREIIDYIELKKDTMELIIIDDASSDNTPNIIKQIISSQNEYKFIENDKNRGKGFCVRKGVCLANGKIIMFFDPDLAYPIYEIDRLLNLVSDQHPIIIASRVINGAVFEVPIEMYSYIYTRHIMSRLFNLLIRMFLLKDIRDTQCGLKIYTRDAAKDIFSKQTIMGFSFDVEILFIAQIKKYSIQCIPVYSKYIYEPSTLSFIADGLDALKSLVKIKWNDLTGKYA